MLIRFGRKYHKSHSLSRIRLRENSPPVAQFERPQLTSVRSKCVPNKTEPGVVESPVRNPLGLHKNKSCAIRKSRPLASTPTARARRRAGEMMDVFDLRAKADVRAPMLSGGMRRRLLLARALMHEPRLVILDEPTAGVDFELRLELWAYIRRLHGEGTTILLTTHYLEEAEELCEEIALIRGGRLLARDSGGRPARPYEADSLADVYVKAMAAAA